MKKKDTWVWSIGHTPDVGYHIILSHVSLWTELRSWFGSTVMHSLPFMWTYRKGADFIIRGYRETEDVMRVPITEEQANELGWDLND